MVAAAGVSAGALTGKPVRCQQARLWRGRQRSLVSPRSSTQSGGRPLEAVAAAEATETEAAAEAAETAEAKEATETAEAAEATEKAEAAMPGEPETAGTNPPATHSNTRQCFRCFSPLAFVQFTCHFFSLCIILQLFAHFSSDPVSNITYTDTYALRMKMSCCRIFYHIMYIKKFV